MRLAALAVLLVLAPAAAWAVAVPCEGFTVQGCAECIRGTGTAKGTCYLCQYNRAPVYTNGKISSCKLYATTCTAVPANKGGGANCRFCDVNSAAGKCIRCKEGFFFNAAGQCVAMTSISTVGTPSPLLTACKANAANTGCNTCNPDGTCRICGAPGTIVLPVNAIWLDAGYPETQCSSVATINKDAVTILGQNSQAPPNCAELDTDFQCAACSNGFGPSAGTGAVTCVANPPGGTKFASGCLTSVPYMQYCRKCDSTGKKCLANQCTASRSLDAAGLCSLNCKGLWGIGCKTCSAAACLTVDPLWVNGR